ncbi:MAG: AsmA-like C-terminal domain-containing protein [Syntrophobacteraceae bacterium]
MRKAKKILIWGGAAAVVIACLAAGLLLLPRLIDMDAVGRKALATLETRYNIHSERVKISIFPYPHAVIYGARMTVPDVLTASADSVAVYPEILALLSGKFRPAQIDLVGPKIAVKLPEQASPEDSAQTPAPHGGENPEKAAADRLARVKDRLAQLQTALSAALPGIVLDVNRGTVEFYSEKGKVFWFEQVAARATVLSDRIEFKLASGKSNLWNGFSFNGRIDPRDWKGSGALHIAGCEPQDLVAFCLPATGSRMGDSRIDLALTLSGSGVRNVRADFTATVSHLTLEEGGDKTVLQNGELGGTVFLDAERLDIGLSRLRFNYPRISLTGRFIKNFSDQTVSLDLDGRNTDAASVREVVLSLDRDNRVTRRIFDIIRQGEVPAISFNSRANTISGLRKMENYTIRGSMEQGVIFAPKAELLVSEARGDVVIVDGVLDGTGLSGRTPGSSTSGGTLKVGLRKEDETFHLDLPLIADLAELPEVLQRVVKNEAFRHELTLLKDVQGKTEGRLVLGERLDNVRVNIETGSFRLAGRYGRVPHPIELEGASFAMDGPKITALALSGKSGRTRITQLDFGYDWGQGLLLEMKTRSSTVVSLDVVEPLIRAREDWKTVLNGGGAPLKGAVLFDTFEFKGPLGDRSKWVFSAGGRVEEMTVQTRYFSGPLTLKTGAFEAGRDTITLKQINAVLADSSLLISGTVNGYFDKPRSADITASGRLGPVGNRDIAALAGLPGTMRAISNLTLDRSRLSWEKGVQTAFEGEMLLASGPKAGIKVVHTPDETVIEELVVKDADSDAVLSLKFREKEFRVGFSGSLSNRTADKLLSENKVLTGPIQGKFAARFYLDEPRKSTAEGQIKISGFQLPLGSKTPARIENAVLEAADNRINIKSAMVSWNGSRLSLGGAVTVVDNAYLVDMNAFADTLDLESLLDARKDERAAGVAPAENTPSGRQPDKGWDAPVRGAIRLRSERLTYGKLTWNPANVDVVISPGLFEVKINQANLCGISTPGRMTLTRDGVKLSLAPEAKNQDVEPVLSCFFDKKRLLTGKYSLKSNLSANGKEGGLIQSLEGDVDFKAEKGRLYRFELLSKIMSVLSITEIYRGHVPDLFTEGCAYDTLSIKGKIKDGKLALTESVLDAPCVKMVFRGEVDLVRKKMNVVALVSTMRTVDRIIEVVPLVNKIFDGGIVSVPVSISGDLYDPSVVPMSPAAVGGELLGFMKRTFQLPFTILQPLAEGGAQNGKANHN